jgi:hypothetical protein
LEHANPTQASGNFAIHEAILVETMSVNPTHHTAQASTKAPRGTRFNNCIFSAFLLASISVVSPSQYMVAAA